jgi:hypothetical protein
MLADKTLKEALAEYEAKHDFARQITLPVEDWARYMPRVRWDGGYRWFRSPNVVCLEKYRLLRERAKIGRIDAELRS